MSGLGDKIRDAGQQFTESAPDMMPGWVLTVGLASWVIIGAAGVFWLFGWFMSVSATVTIPLIVAMVIGMVAYPLCEKLMARGLGKSAAAGLVLLLLFVIVGVVIWVTVKGIVAQWPAIQQQVQAGLDALAATLDSFGINATAVRDALTAAKEAGAAPSGDALSSLGSALTAGLSSAFGFLFAVFIGTTLLFYVLSDFPTISNYLGRHMGGLPVAVGEGIVDDAVGAMRGYFRGTTITGGVVALVIGVSMLLLGVPLAATVALVTFMTCYIPYFGAIISGAFAFLVALGTNGLPTAILLLVIVLVVQNVLQTVINARVMGDSLDLHPLVILVVTLLGGIFAGILGAALGAPLTALFLKAGKRLSAAFEPGASTAEGYAEEAL
jgi:predicted PurR-regulated permease PerM